MEPPKLLAALIDLAQSLGMEVRRVPAGAETCASPGGALVRLRGRELLFLDPTASAADQISVVAEALAGRSELEDRFLPPEIRERIDAAKGP